MTFLSQYAIKLYSLNHSLAAGDIWVYSDCVILRYPVCS